jgi:hypothetical protein
MTGRTFAHSPSDASLGNEIGCPSETPPASDRGFPVNTGAQTIASLRSGQAFCDAVYRRCSSERAVRLAGAKNYCIDSAIVLSGVGRGFQRFVRYIAHKDIVVIPIDVVCVGHRVIPRLVPRQTPDRPS